MLRSIEGIAVCCALVWKLYQLARLPKHLPLRLVTVCLALAVASFPCEALLDPSVMAQTRPGPIWLMWLHESILLPLFYTLICFFLFSALNARQARRRARREGVVLGCALTVLTAIALALRGGPSASYPLALVSVFFLTADLYTVYGFAVAMVWTRRYAASAGRRLARGLELATIGLVALEVATTLTIAIVIIHWAGGRVAAWLVNTQPLLLVPGIVVFMAGVSYPGLAMRLAAARIWCRHLGAYHRLRPLWSLLHEAFPEDAFHRVPTGRWRDMTSLRGIHRRYYRRVIECRDGLVRLSPFVANATQDGPAPVSLADQIHAALKSAAVGETAPQHVVPLAVPDSTGLEADAARLVALSQSLQGRSVL
ncbi:MAB_1171c family putative transporter [Streptomyces humicola]|uniref:MAB_1171c family putative transporter n=1 Tax=Streptomyces humicola TaxID=2953240 RepID=UPI00210B5DA9|nr:MAB_1171c family putative transporter [Streptomyces humicola]